MGFKPRAVLILVLGALCLGAGGGYYLREQNASRVREQQFQEISRTVGGIKVYFSPKGGCTEAVVYAINNAQKSILLQAYSFTSDPIETALKDAVRRGVEVHVIVDRSQYEAKGAAAQPLYDAGIDVRIDCKHQIAHDKVIIIDSFTVITGSFNFTRQAEIGNAENLLVINSSDLAATYIENWQKHYQHSEPFNPAKAKK